VGVYFHIFVGLALLVTPIFSHVGLTAPTPTLTPFPFGVLLVLRCARRQVVPCGGGAVGVGGGGFYRMCRGVYGPAVSSPGVPLSSSCESSRTLTVAQEGGVR